MTVLKFRKPKTQPSFELTGAMRLYLSAFDNRLRAELDRDRTAVLSADLMMGEGLGLLRRDKGVAEAERRLPRTMGLDVERRAA